MIEPRKIFIESCKLNVDYDVSLLHERIEKFLESYTNKITVIQIFLKYFFNSFLQLLTVSKYILLETITKYTHFTIREWLVKVAGVGIHL